MTQDLFIGIDISKAKLDVASSPGEHSWSVSNTEEGIQELIAKIRQLGTPKIMVSLSHWSNPARCRTEGVSRHGPPTSPGDRAAPPTSILLHPSEEAYYICRRKSTAFAATDKTVQLRRASSK